MFEHKLAGWLSRLVHGREQVRAHGAIEAEARPYRTRLARRGNLLRQAAQAMKPDESLCIGTTDQTDLPRVPLYLGGDAIARGHGWVMARTGGGKSYLILAVLAQLLPSIASGTGPAVVILDMKGELADLVRRLLARWLAQARVDTALFRSRYAVVAPFGARYLPELQVLKRDRSVPIEVQAYARAVEFEATVGAELGLRQADIFTHLLALAIERGWTFPELPRLLSQPAELATAAAQSSVPATREYFLSRFHKEKQTSLAGVFARLDAFMRLPSTRAMLSAERMLDFRRLLSGGLTIIDLGGAPLGCEAIQRYFGTIMVTQLVWSLMDRKVEETTPPALVVMDEFQEALTADQARSMERVLALARSKRVALWALHQQVAQLERVAPTLPRILKTNTRFQILGGGAPEDLRAFTHLFPTTGLMKRAAALPTGRRADDDFLTAAEERETRIAEAAAMGPRSFLCFDREAPWGAVRIRSPRIQVADWPELQATVQAEILEFVERGTVGVPIRELEARAAARIRGHEQAVAVARAAPPAEEASTNDPVTALPANAEGTPVHGQEGRRRRRRRRRSGGTGGVDVG